MDYSIIVPVYNEAGNLKKLHEQIKTIMKPLGSYEILYVDDGSTDESVVVLESIGATVIQLQRNYGQSIAMDAGFRACKGRYVITLDADLQNDPADIPQMVAFLKEKQLDVVAGWRKKRKDAVKFKIITRVARLLRRLFINDGVHDSGCTLRVYRKEAVDALSLWGEMHRFIIALLRWKGFRVGEIEVNHRPRYTGNTKYGAGKAIRGLIDLVYVWFIMKYSGRPLHLYGLLSLLSAFFGIVCLGWMISLKIRFGTDLSNSAWFMVGMFLLGLSVMFFSFGIVMDLLLRVYMNSSSVEKRYLKK